MWRSAPGQDSDSKADALLSETRAERGALSPYWSRRGFLMRSMAMGAGIAAGLALTAPALRRAHAQEIFGTVVDTQPFARLERLAESVYAAVSTPFSPDGGFGDATTLCNGGLIAGKEAVVAVDGFFRPGGAAWLNAQAEALFGRPVSHVVITHYHADHTGGLAGFQRGAEGPEILATKQTHDLLLERYGVPAFREGEDIGSPRVRLLAPTRVFADGTQTHELDLGGRSLTLTMGGGHTPSDVTLDLSDAPITFAGDLIWEGVFPNFMDAEPSRLMTTVRSLLADKDRVIVGGHGAVATGASLAGYLGALEAVEQRARDGYAKGQSAQEAAEGFTLPQSVGQWRLFSPRYFEVAIAAWYKEFGAAKD